MLVALAATGCGSSGSAADHTTSTAPRTTTTTTPDDRIARAGLLVATDLPDGFTASSAVGSRLSELLRSTDACAHLPAFRTDASASARSTSFGGTASAANDEVGVYADAATAEAYAEGLRDPAAVDCLRSAVVASLGTPSRGVTYDDISVSPLAVNDAGDAVAGFRVTITSSSGTLHSTSLLDLTFVRVDRVMILLTTAGNTSAALAELDTTIPPKVVDRVRAALAS